jgi:hypothetical protein
MPISSGAYATSRHPKIAGNLLALANPDNSPNPESLFLNPIQAGSKTARLANAKFEPGSERKTPHTRVSVEPSRLYPKVTLCRNDRTAQACSPRHV